MSKILLGLLALIFCLNSFAASGTVEELARVVDDYQYSLTVDWDQKDQAQNQKITNDFYDKLDKLTLKDGLNVADLEQMMASKIKDPTVLANLKLKIQLLGKSATRSDVLELLKLESKNLYSKGASWNGDATLTYGIIAVVVGIVAYAIYFQLTHDCVKWEESDHYSCHASQHYSCDSFSLSCGDVSGPDECGYDTVCTQYVKK